MVKILTIKNKKENEVLRRETSFFDFQKFSKKEIRELIKKMNRAMVDAGGVGLAANQIGLDLSVFIARVDRKFYAIFNPKLTKISENMVYAEEGCLSVPDIAASIRRPEKVILEGYDRNGKKIKIKAWGVLARVLEHEVDHLGGKLFIDYLKKR